QGRLLGVRQLPLVLRRGDVAERDATIVVGGAAKTVEIELARHVARHSAMAQVADGRRIGEISVADQGEELVDFGGFREDARYLQGGQLGTSDQGFGLAGEKDDAAAKTNAPQEAAGIEAGGLAAQSIVEDRGIAVEKAAGALEIVDTAEAQATRGR